MTRHFTFSAHQHTTTTLSFIRLAAGAAVATTWWYVAAKDKHPPFVFFTHCLQQLSTLVLLPLLVLVPAALGQDFTELDWDAESRQLQVRSLIMFDIVHVVKE